jgi:hypothetical protein
MVSRAPEGFLVDPEDPRAPSQEIWDRMSSAAGAGKVAAHAQVPAHPGPARAICVASPRARGDDRGEKLRFFHYLSVIPEPEEVISRLGIALDSLISRQDELQRKLEEAEQNLEEERRAREDAERKLAEALAEIARLKPGG